MRKRASPILIVALTVLATLIIIGISNVITFFSDYPISFADLGQIAWTPSAFFILALLLEFIVFLVLAIRQLIIFARLFKKKIPVKQEWLDSQGQAMFYTGGVIVSIITRILKNDFSLTGDITYLLATIVGFSIIIIGLHFRIAAHEAENETPNWIMRISKFWPAY